MLTVIRSNRLERLADELARRLAVEPRASVLEPEVVSVQSQGMRAWLGQQLALRLGVFAGVRTPFPRDLLDEVFAAVIGRRPGREPAFRPEVLAFAAAGLLPGLLGDPLFEPLAGYLRDDGRGLKLHQLSRVLARTFDEYLTFRPEMILEWQERPPEGSWQAVLWNALRRRAGPQARHVSECARELLEAVAQGRADAAPRRLSLFGVTTLPPLHVRILAALPVAFDVRWYLLAPTPEYFADMDRGALETAPAGEAGHPLLSSLGRVGRELQQVLLEDGGNGVHEIDLFEEPAPGGALHALQREVFETRAGPAHPADGTIEIHSCHGPAREAEVLKDRLLAFLDDPELGLAPHDVLVLTPDVETYAPYLEAALSRDALPGRALPVEVADARPRGDAPAAEAFAALLGLVRGRLRLSEVVDFLAREPVRSRFGLDAADVEALHRMLAEAGVRWGADARHREAAGQPPAGEHTWRFGLDRLLLGRALPGDRGIAFGGVAPVDTEGLDAAALLDALARFTEALFAACSGLDSRRTPREWHRLLGEVRASLIAPAPEADGEPDAVPRLLSDFAEAASTAGFDAPVDFEVARDALLQAIDERPNERRFLSRGVQICDLKPMRSIPARVVALAGMNDGAFPRTRIAPGFDLIRERPRAGDRSIREDDRYLFLEALLSARDRLVITFSGRDAGTGEAKSPAVVLAELLESVDRAALLEHPLHPFDPRYFRPGPDGAPAAGGPPYLFTYAEGLLGAARAAAGERREPPSFAPGRLVPAPTAEPRVIRLEDLVRFWRSPPAWFLERRLGVRPLPRPGEEDDREPAVLDSLAGSAVGRDVLDWLLAGDAENGLAAWLRARGALPHGAMGSLALEAIRRKVEPVLREGLAVLEGPLLAPVDLRLDLRPGGTDMRLAARLGDLRRDARARCRYLRLGPKALLEHWLGHLALCAAPHGAPRRSTLVGRAEGGDGARRIDLAPLERDAARARIEDLAGLLLEGEAAPLPFEPDLSYAFAVAARGGGEPLPALEVAHEGWRKLLDEGPPWAARLFDGADPFDGGPGGAEPPFAAAAKRVFDPLLAHLDPEGGP